MHGIREFVSNIITGYNNRFPDDELYKALEMFDPRNLPASEAAWKQVSAHACMYMHVCTCMCAHACVYMHTVPACEHMQVAMTYGNASMDVLVEHFGRPHIKTYGKKTVQYAAVVREGLVRAEWALLRQGLASAWYAHLKTAQPKALAAERECAIDQFINDFYQSVLQGERYVELSVIVAIWRIQCLSSVDCERGFSLMALIKTRLSNRMSTTLLDARMQIASEGPSLADGEGVKMIINDAIVCWKGMCKRNVRKSHPGICI